MQVKAVGSVLGIGGAVRSRLAAAPARRGAPTGPVVLRGHAADEARRAVAALRAAPPRHLLLHGMQVARQAKPLGRDDLLSVEREDRRQAGVERRPEGAAVPVRAGDHHRTGAALALGAPLLGPGQTLLA